MPGRAGTGARLASLQTLVPTVRVWPAIVMARALTVRVPSPAVVCWLSTIVASGPNPATVVFGAGLDASEIASGVRSMLPLVMVVAPLTVSVFVLKLHD